jgi:hypothetical protein
MLLSSEKHHETDRIFLPVASGKQNPGFLLFFAWNDGNVQYAADVRPNECNTSHKGFFLYLISARYDVTVQFLGKFSGIKSHDDPFRIS